jgi:hypothetical protein
VLGGRGTGNVTAVLRDEARGTMKEIYIPLKMSPRWSRKEITAGQQAMCAGTVNRLDISRTSSVPAETAQNSPCLGGRRGNRGASRGSACTFRHAGHELETINGG